MSVLRSIPPFSEKADFSVSIKMEKRIGYGSLALGTGGGIYCLIAGTALKGIPVAGAVAGATLLVFGSLSLLHASRRERGGEATFAGGKIELPLAVSTLAARNEWPLALDLEKGINLNQKIEQTNRWPFWKKTLVGVAAIAAIGAIAKLILPLVRLTNSDPDPIPIPCTPGVDFGCSGPLFSTVPPNPQRGPLQRHFTIGTVYDNGLNAERQQISDLVDKSHKQYAAKWGLNHQIVKGNLVAQKCLHPRTNRALDCNVYVNKLQRIRDWLSQPGKPGIEEWLVYMDDDMPITNMRIGMNEIIDALRNNKDTSVIMAEDLHDWQTLYRHRMKRHVPHASVNTGLIIVRKDAKAKAFIERVWAHRNDPIDIWNENCLTLGQCKGTIDSIVSLLDQEMMGAALVEDPSVMDQIVSVVPPRDTASKIRSHIALNTLNYRNWCFSKCEYGQAIGWPGYFAWGDTAKPDWTWQKGDFCGQPAGVYMIGKEFPLLSNGHCPGDNYSVPCTTPRLNRIRDQILNTVW